MRAHARRTFGIAWASVAIFFCSSLASAADPRFVKEEFCARADATTALWAGGALATLREALAQERKARCATARSAREVAAALVSHCQNICPSFLPPLTATVECEQACGVYGALDQAFLSGVVTASRAQSITTERRPAEETPKAEKSRRKGEAKVESPRLAEPVNALLGN